MEKTGLGHQYNVTARSYGACQNSLGQAYQDIAELKEESAYLIRMEILKLMRQCLELSYSANEALKLNQD